MKVVVKTENGQLRKKHLLDQLKERHNVFCYLKLRLSFKTEVVAEIVLSPGLKREIK